MSEKTKEYRTRPNKRLLRELDRLENYNENLKILLDSYDLQLKGKQPASNPRES